MNNNDIDAETLLTVNMLLGMFERHLAEAAEAGTDDAELKKLCADFFGVETDSSLVTYFSFFSRGYTQGMDDSIYLFRENRFISADEAARAFLAKSPRGAKAKAQEILLERLTVKDGKEICRRCRHFMKKSKGRYTYRSPLKALYALSKLAYIVGFSEAVQEYYEKAERAYDELFEANGAGLKQTAEAVNEAESAEDLDYKLEKNCYGKRRNEK